MHQSTIDCQHACFIKMALTARLSSSCLAALCRASHYFPSSLVCLDLQSDTLFLCVACDRSCIQIDLEAASQLKDAPCPFTCMAAVLPSLSFSRFVVIQNGMKGPGCDSPIPSSLTAALSGALLSGCRAWTIHSRQQLSLFMFTFACPSLFEQTHE